MFLKTWARGWRDKADVVADDISAGSQDEEITRHHSSSLRGPRTHPSDTPPIKAAQTPSPTDLADPLRICPMTLSRKPPVQKDETVIVMIAPGLGVE